MSNKDFALELAGLGWYIHPCKVDKKPLTEHGKDDATNEPEKIRAWWQRWPEALIGINCERSGFFALDIDRKNGVDGLLSWADLVQCYGGGVDVAAGPAQYTPSGGIHLLFKLPQNVKIPNNASKLAPGLDLRSAGYICTGGAYRWMDAHPPQAQLTGAPSWMIELIARMTEIKTGAEYSAPEEVDPKSAGAYWLIYYTRRANIGNRNENGFNLACQLRDSRLSESEAAGFMRAYAHQVPNGGRDPYTEKEALASLKSAYNGARREAAVIPGLSGNWREKAITEPMPEPKSIIREDPQALILLTELGNSRRFSQTYRGQLLHVEAWDWMIWNGQKWEIDETGHVVALGKNIVDSLFSEAQGTLSHIKQLAGDMQHAETAEREELKERLDGEQKQANNLLKWAMQSQSAQKISAMINLAKSDLPARVTDFDTNPWHLNCQNGTIDLKTGELLPHKPENRITKIAGAAYDPGTKCPNWLKFLDRVFDGNQELIDYIQRAVGYSLTGDTSEQVFFFLFGNGRNGKSTFTNAIAALLGDYFHKAQSQTFMLRSGQSGPTDGVAALVGARFVSASELARGQRLDEQIVKDLTGGGDLIPARHLYKSLFNFKPALKLWFYGNEKPQVSGTDEGIWRRVRLIPFTVTIPENEVDPVLSEKLEAELPGILSWAIRGCMDWRQHGLGMPEAIKAATREYRSEEDQIAQWIDENLETGPNYEASITDLHDSFTRWGGGWSVKALGKELRRRGYEPIRKNSGMFYKGLGLPKTGF